MCALVLHHKLIDSAYNSGSDVELLTAMMGFSDSSSRRSHST
jgi:hypothetical protein